MAEGRLFFRILPAAIKEWQRDKKNDPRNVVLSHVLHVAAGGAGYELKPWEVDTLFMDYGRWKNEMVDVTHETSSGEPQSFMDFIRALSA